MTGQDDGRQKDTIGQACKKNDSVTKKTEDKLLKKEDYLQAFLNNMPICVAHVCWENGKVRDTIKILKYNKHAMDVLGYSDEELRRFTECRDFRWVYPDDREAFFNALEDCSAKGVLEDFNCMMRVVKKDGSIGWMRVYMGLTISQENCEGFLVATDVTQEHQVGLLKLQQEILEKTPACTGLVRYNDGRIECTYLNDSFYRLMEENRESRKQKYGDDLFLSMHEEDREGLLLELESSMRQGSMVDYNYRIRTASGEFKWINFKAQPSALSGSQAVYYAAFTDIDILKRSELAMRKEYTLLYQILSGMQISYWLVDFDKGTTTFSKRAQQEFGMPREMKNTSQMWESLSWMDEDKLQAMTDSLEQLRSGASNAELELFYQSNSTMQWNWIRIHYTVLSWKKGEVERAVATAVNINREKEMERRYAEEWSQAELFKENTLFNAVFNLTTNEMLMSRCIDGVFDNCHTLKDHTERLSGLLIQKTYTEDLKSLWDAQKLMLYFEEGRRRLREEYQRKFSDGSIKWVRAEMVLTEHPVNRDVMAFVYEKDIDEEKRNHLVSQTIIGEGYELLFLLDTVRKRVYVQGGNQNCFLGKLLLKKKEKIQRIHDLLPHIMKYAVDMTEEQIYAENNMFVVREKLEKDAIYKFKIRLRNPETGHIEDKTCIYRYLANSRHEIVCGIMDVTAEVEGERARNEQLTQLLNEATAARNTIELLERDELTGLYNKQAFYNRAQKIIAEHPHEKYAILAMDVEKFKLVNDIFGVEEGDKLLVFIARQLEVIKEIPDAICARGNADVFFVLFPCCEEYLQQIKDTSHMQKISYQLPMNIQVKYGIYKIVNPTMPISAMCDRAALAIESIKGIYDRNLAFYDTSMREKIVVEQRIVDAMGDALEQGQFHVYLQPKYNPREDRLAGAEALVRWTHPEYGFMSPADFIPIFEKNRFISSLDMYVWEQSCRILQEWKKKHGSCIPISVNVSRLDIYNLDLPKIMTELIERYQIEPECLHLEITETAYTEDSEQLVDVVKRLKELGFIIEMDDFGSGYSSLNMLSKLPIDVLKMDMKFIQQEEDGQKCNVMRFVIELAKRMNLTVTAEGVETREQVEMLKEMHCDLIQGYYYSKPIPAESFEALLEQ